ncbi:MAG: hypothetical protein Q7U80_17080, partial [Thiobacillus sp.]|nr:hypothetical protein [Thiobacillus sp.]
AKALDAAMTRLEPAWTQAVATWPRNVTFKDSDQQAAYDDALGSAGHYPKYEPLRLRLRLPVVLDTIAKRLMGGLAHILSVADARF